MAHNLRSANHKNPLLHSLYCHFTSSSFFLSSPSSHIPQSKVSDLHLCCFITQNASCLYFGSAVFQSADVFYKLSVGVWYRLKSAGWFASPANLKMTKQQKKLKDVELQSQPFFYTVRFFFFGWCIL